MESFISTNLGFLLEYLILASIESALSLSPNIVKDQRDNSKELCQRCVRVVPFLHLSHSIPCFAGFQGTVQDAATVSHNFVILVDPNFFEGYGR